MKWKTKSNSKREKYECIYRTLANERVFEEEQIHVIIYLLLINWLLTMQPPQWIHWKVHLLRDMLCIKIVWNRPFNYNNEQYIRDSTTFTSLFPMNLRIKLRDLETVIAFILQPSQTVLFDCTSFMITLFK